LLDFDVFEDLAMMRQQGSKNKESPNISFA
jgi:hypothetical protein